LLLNSIPRRWLLQCRALSVRVDPLIVCGPSALFLHGLAPRPAELWLAVPASGRFPFELGVSWGLVPAKRLRASCGALCQGRLQIWVASPARAVAEGFAWRNRVGRQCAVDAASAYLRRGGNLPQLTAQATAYRVRTIMRQLVGVPVPSPTTQAT